MKYPKLKAEWVPVENPDEKGVTHQNFKAYMNGELVFEKGYDPFQSSVEFFIPAWDERGNLLVDPSAVITTCLLYTSPSPRD